MLPADARGFALVGLDGGVLAFVTALSVLCGLFFGLAPAASASRVDLAVSMKAGGQRASGPGRTRLRSSFIAAEVALAVVLAVGAGLLIRTLWGLTRVDPGFRPEQTLTVRVSPNPATCQERAACVALYDELLRRAGGLTGIGDVAAANALPLSGQEPLLPVEMEGHPLVVTEGQVPLLWAGAVTPAYFRVMRIPLLRGRVFDDSDGERTARVVLVSAATARRYWPDEDPIGKRIRVVWDDDWRTVVGVVGDVRQYALSGRSPAEITGALYMPYPQAVALDRRIPTAMTLLVAVVRRSVRDRASGCVALVASVNPDVPVSDVRSMDGGRVVLGLRAALDDVALRGLRRLCPPPGRHRDLRRRVLLDRAADVRDRRAGGDRRDPRRHLRPRRRPEPPPGAHRPGARTSWPRSSSAAPWRASSTVSRPRTRSRSPWSAGSSLLTALLAGYVPGRRAAATDPVRALRVD